MRIYTKRGVYKPLDNRNEYNLNFKLSKGVVDTPFRFYI
jgi:hypothetical protein